MSRRILFVDDDPDFLEGVQRSFSHTWPLWEFEFVTSGDEALKALFLRPFDAVITELRMRGMTGPQLLDEVRQLYPQIVRIILSGSTDVESMLRSIGSAHQLLPKPCDAESLKPFLERTFAMKDMLGNASIAKFISRLKCIPSLPLLYQEVASELRSADPSPTRLGKIISQDLAMTAKLLQIVNSAAYGLRMEVAEPRRAIELLGLDTIQIMILSLSVFSAFDQRVLSPQVAKALHNHSACVADYSAIIAKAEGVAVRDLGAYQSAGLLHNIGKLVIASADPREFRMIENLATSTGTHQCLMENEVLGCNHAEIGAYLLSLWGLPSSIVEAVAWHHLPSASPITEFSPLCAVHVSNAIHAKLNPEFQSWGADIDLEFLERIRLTNRQEEWIELCNHQTALTA